MADLSIKEKAIRIRKIKTAINYTLLVFCTSLSMFPFVWMILTSLKPSGEVLSSKIELFGSRIEWSNYSTAWNYLPFGQFMLNSLFVAVSGTVITLITSSMAAYAFSRLRFRGRDTLFGLYLTTLMIPQQVIIIPLFLMMNKMGWTNSYASLIIPWAFTAYGTFLMRQFYLTLPYELDEASRIDGCGHMGVFLRILLPQLKPALVTLAVITFLGYWNGLLWPLVILNQEMMWTLPIGLQMFMGQYGTEWNLLMAATTITTIPGIIIFIFAQKYYVQGISMSGMGGR
ncbi:MAG: carbohydrate ABC transporter permease [Clostridiaceae bacterium]